MSRRIPIAVAALLHDHHVLMVHRRPDRQWYPDCWDLPGGHVEAGESPEQAVARECHEELGIRVVTVRPFSLPIADPAIEMHAFVGGAMG